MSLTFRLAINLAAISNLSYCSFCSEEFLGVSCEASPCCGGGGGGGQTGLLADVGSQTFQDCFAASLEQF